jgi:Zn-dependent M28 family amino/carboxypeptidase
MVFILFPVILFSGCKTDKRLEKVKDTDIAMKQAITVPGFNADSAYHFIQDQVKFGPRIPNTPSHLHTGNYLISKLKEYNAIVEVQEFQEKAYDGEILTLKNIIASYYPEKTRRILLAAHWDTRPFADKDGEDPRATFEGANDGGSGVGVLLEVARILASERPNNAGIDIIFFDGEDYGEPEFYDGNTINSGKSFWCLGSQYWSNNKHRKNYMAYYGILLDMVGAKDAVFYKEGGSMQFAKKIVEKVWDAGIANGYSQYFINKTSPGITDDHIFVNQNAKIPMINIVEYNPESPGSYFSAYHHTQQDNMTLIDRATLKAVGQTLLYVIFNE